MNGICIAIILILAEAIIGDDCEMEETAILTGEEEDQEMEEAEDTDCSPASPRLFALCGRTTEERQPPSPVEVAHRGRTGPAYPELAASLRFGREEKGTRPCSDFYKFVCDGYHRQLKEAGHEPGDHATLAETDLNQQLHIILNDPSVRARHSGNPVFRRLFFFYKQCTARQPTADEQVREVKEWLKEQQWAHAEAKLDADWMQMAFPFVPFLTLFKVPQDIAQKPIQRFDLEVHINHESLEHTLIPRDNTEATKESWRKMMQAAMLEFYAENLFGRGGLQTTGDEEAAERTQKVLELDQNFARFYEENKHLDALPTTEVDGFEAIGEIFGDILPMDWSHFANEQFNWGRKFEPGTGRLLVQRELLFAFKGWFSSVLHSEDPVAVSDYLKWHYVWSMLPSLELASLREETLQTDSKFSWDYDKHNCLVDYARKLFPHLLDRLFVEETVGRAKIAAFEEGELLFRYVREAYTQMIAHNAWMDPATKAVAQEKLAAMERVMGYVPFIFEPEVLKTLYGGLKLHKRMSWRELVLAAKRNEAMQPYLKVYEPAFVWNAFYAINANVLFVTSTYFQLPEFDLQLPIAFNFGVLGAVLGHEISHGFDNDGMLYDKDGRRRDWLSEQSARVFLEKKRCFETQYENYWRTKYQRSYRELERRLGVETVGEDIADNAAIKATYRALQMYKRDRERGLLDESHWRRPRAIWGMDQYGEEQLFFIASAFDRCETKSAEYREQLENSQHSYASQRANLPLANFQAFADAFHCRKGDKMNPRDAQRCSLW